MDFDQYDWLGEGDSMTWVPLLPNGLKGLQDCSFGSIAGRLFKDGEEPFSKGSPFQKQTENVNPFLYAFQKEWAARADWCVKPYKECAYPPVVSVDETELFAYPGETVQLHGNCNPSDGKPIHIEWFVYKVGRRIDSAELLSYDKEECSVTVSSDAVPGECLIICLACEMEGFPSITRYAETAVRII